MNDGYQADGRRLLAALALVLLFQATGCRSRSAEDFIPDSELSKAAVASALDTWRDGGAEAKPVDVSDGQVRVEWVDNTRETGRALADYTILGETPATNARTFVVVLRFADSPEVVKCRYLVVGIDPLWVFRQEDYDMLAHWDHVMPTEETAASTALPDANEQDP